MLWDLDVIGRHVGILQICCVAIVIMYFVSVEAQDTALFGIGMGGFFGGCNVEGLFHSNADAARSRQSFDKAKVSRAGRLIFGLAPFFINTNNFFTIINKIDLLIRDNYKG